jgi:hypothetical protein
VDDVLPDPNLLRGIARAMPMVPSTAPAGEQVDLVVGLGELARAIVEHNRRFMAGEPVDWVRLADLLAAAQWECRRQVVLELDDAGDAGSR